MRAHELMTRKPVCVTPDDTLQEAARLMASHDCGLLPVVESRNSSKVVGVISDRDITLRAVARGLDSTTKVREAMTADPQTCDEESAIDDLQRVMSDRQVRRVVVVDGGGACVGIVAQADLARAASRAGGVTPTEVASVVERISVPEKSH